MTFKIRFKDRVFEWWLASGTAGFGWFVIMPPPSMDSPAYSQLVEWFSEAYWGFFFLATGILHLTALVINGRRWWTPIVRSFTTALNTFAYVFLAFGFFQTDPWSTAVFSYAPMIGSAALICFFRAMKDTRHAIVNRQRGHVRKGAVE